MSDGSRWPSIPEKRRGPCAPHHLVRIRRKRENFVAARDRCALHDVRAVCAGQVSGDRRDRLVLFQEFEGDRDERTLAQDDARSDDAVGGRFPARPSRGGQSPRSPKTWLRKHPGSHRRLRGPARPPVFAATGPRRSRHRRDSVRARPKGLAAAERRPAQGAQHDRHTLQGTRPGRRTVRIDGSLAEGNARVGPRRPARTPVAASAEFR